MSVLPVQPLCCAFSCAVLHGNAPFLQQEGLMCGLPAAPQLPSPACADHPTCLIPCSIESHLTRQTWTNGAWRKNPGTLVYYNGEPIRQDTMRYFGQGGDFAISGRYRVCSSIILPGGSTFKHGDEICIDKVGRALPSAAAPCVLLLLLPSHVLLSRMCAHGLHALGLWAASIPGTAISASCPPLTCVMSLGLATTSFSFPLPHRPPWTAHPASPMAPTASSTSSTSRWVVQEWLALCLLLRRF